MRFVWALVAGIGFSGCSGHRAAAPCSGPANIAAVIYYPACAVDREAKPISATGPRLMYTPSSGQTCVRAVIDFVVDERGMPVPETAKLVRTNDNGFATAVMGSLTTLRYEPARKNGQAVAQLVRLEPVMVLVRTTGGPPSQAAARSAGRSC